MSDAPVTTAIDPASAIEDRIRERAAALRKEADEIKIHAEREIAARLTAAAELERLLQEPTP